MSLLRLAVLGPPEVFHDESRLTFPLRKAQSLLLYLAVEKGLHPRSKLAALLWPDSAARTALSNAIALLRSRITDASSTGSSHLLCQQDLLGLDPQTALWLDLDVVQQAYQQAQQISTVPHEQDRASLVNTLQHALSLVRGPFLDGFWLREETPFDGWVQQQQQQWQVRLHLLCDRLSSWQEAGGELEQAQATLVRWLALDPLSEEAYRRLMRVHLALGDATAALQVYATCRSRLAQELQVEPSADIVAQAAHVRARRAACLSASQQVHTVLVQKRLPFELIAPLIGRKASFAQLIGSFQQVWQGQPQAVFVMGEVGIGKTRLANEFVAWARAQGADVLSGHTFELEGRLPYQPLVEALRRRLEEENAPEDLLEDLWLAELSRIFPELRVRYPDLAAPTCDPLTDRLRLFEAVARFLDALARQAPLVLFLDDLHWVDEASLDLVHYLGRYWKEHGSRVLLLGTVRRDQLKFNPPLLAQLVDLKCDLPITQITLQSLSQAETFQLVEAIFEEEHGGRSAERRYERSSEWKAPSVSPASKAAVVALGNFLFAQTGGLPLYLLETLKVFRDRELLVQRLGANGIWRLETTREMVAAIGQEQSRRELVPPWVRVMIQARLAKLSKSAYQLVMACAVLRKEASAQCLWQVAAVSTLSIEQGMVTQAGFAALEEAVESGLLREEIGVGCLSNYGFANDLVREVIYTELSQARWQVLHQRTLALFSGKGERGIFQP
jgi:DNA-binding SARP family transcriptional activator